jgi:hypothetical protein
MSTTTRRSSPRRVKDFRRVPRGHVAGNGLSCYLFRPRQARNRRRETIHRTRRGRREPRAVHPTVKPTSLCPACCWTKTGDTPDEKRSEQKECGRLCIVK